MPPTAVQSVRYQIWWEYARSTSSLAIMWKAMQVLMAVSLLGGCASTSKTSPEITAVNHITIAPPMIDLEEFPSGNPIQSSDEDRMMQDDLEKMAKIMLEKKFAVALAPEIPREIMGSIKSKLAKLVLDLKQARDIAAVRTSRPLRFFLNEHFGDGDVLITYYRGYQRSKKSMASGYQSSAFLAELGSKDGAMDGTNKNPMGASNKNPMGTDLRPIYPNPPDECGTTLTVLLLAGVEKEAVYFNTLHLAENPKDPEVMGRLVNITLKPMKDLEYE